MIASFQSNSLMIALDIGLPKRIIALYTLIHNFRLPHHFGKYCIESSLSHMLGILVFVLHDCLKPLDIPDYHVENSRLSHFEMRWFLLCRMNMRFSFSTSFSSVCGRD